MIRLRATKREAKLHAEWRAAEKRLQSALAVVATAQAAVLNAEIAFKAAAALKHGTATTFEFAGDKLVFVKPKGAK